MADKAYLERLLRELTSQGQLIEAGWLGMRAACDLHDAPAIKLIEMRMAFFGGAKHLFYSIMNMMEPGAEPTDKDLERLHLIDRELRKFIAEFQMRNIPTKGSA